MNLALLHFKRCPFLLSGCLSALLYGFISPFSSKQQQTNALAVAHEPVSAVAWSEEAVRASAILILHIDQPDDLPPNFPRLLRMWLAMYPCTAIKCYTTSMGETVRSLSAFYGLPAALFYVCAPDQSDFEFTYQATLCLLTKSMRGWL
jgi:hypothetical protein